MFCQSTINRNSEAVWPDVVTPHPFSLPFSLSLFISLSLFLFLRHLCTPWHRTPNVGDADVKRHRYLTVTHSAPLYPHHNCNILLTSQNSPFPSYTPPSPLSPLHLSECASLSILHPCFPCKNSLGDI